MRKRKKIVVTKPPHSATNNGPPGGVKFLHGPRPKPRTFPPDPDRDKKIAEFLAKRKKEQKK